MIIDQIGFVEYMIKSDLKNIISRLKLPGQHKSYP